MRVLVTRAADDAARTAARLTAAGHMAVFSPLLAIVGTSAPIPAQPSDAILATSLNALRFAEALPATLDDTPWFIVGARLADALLARHLGQPALASADVAGLIAGIAARCPAPARFLYLAGRDRKPALEQALAAAGHEVTIVETYAAVGLDTFAPEALAALRAGTIEAVLHFSRRTADLFVAAACHAGLTLEAVHHVAISADAADPLIARGWRVTVAAAPHEEGVIAALGNLARR